MNEKDIINWLLKGDVSIQFQVYRDLLNESRPDLQERIEKEGWGRQFLLQRSANGHWGKAFYQPKWTSSHYTILDLKNLCISPDCQLVKETLELILKYEKGPDGGINPVGSTQKSDVCINGMALNYFSYFKTAEEKLHSAVDFLLCQKMKDGGFNCHSNRKGAHHSSLHTTLSVLEGILEYKRNNYSYRLNELIEAERSSVEFILQHRLFKSDKTGKIINKRMIEFPYPTRWKYDILRALDHFQNAGFPFDVRMEDALSVVLKKRNKDYTWNLHAKHPGKFHFHMETPGKPSRWNTLRAMRVLKSYPFHHVNFNL